MVGGQTESDSDKTYSESLDSKTDSDDETVSEQRTKRPSTKRRAGTDIKSYPPPKKIRQHDLLYIDSENDFDDDDSYTLTDVDSPPPTKNPYKTHNVLQTSYNYTIVMTNIVNMAKLKMSNTKENSVNLRAVGLDERINNVHKGLDDNNIIELAKPLKTNTNIIKLDLTINNIGVVGARALSEALQSNHTLKELLLSNNQIGDAGAVALANALRAPNSSLEVLEIASNNIGAKGAIAIANALQYRREQGLKGGLEKLDFTLNHIGDAGTKALAEALDKSNYGLEYLAIRNNNIGPDGAIALATALKTNTSLTGLDLFGNDIQDNGAIAFADCIKYNKTLDHLNLQYNNITDIGIYSIFIALEDNENITDLIIEQKNNSKELIDLIDKKLALNTSRITRNMIGPTSK